MIPMSPSLPLVTAIISAYQQPAFLNQALDAVRAQTYANLQIIIIDDASGKEHTDQYKLPPNATLIVHPERRATAAISRNNGLRLAEGKYIAFLDQDDIWLPGKIAAQVETLEKNSTALLTFTHYQRVDADLQPTGKNKAAPVLTRDPLKQLICSNIIHCPSQVMMRRSAFDAIGPFDETIRGAADWDMWIRTAAAGPIIPDPRTLTLYRTHPHQWSRKSLMMVKGSSRVMEKTAQWSRSSRPDLRRTLLRRQSRWLSEVARIQLETPEEFSLARRTALTAIRTWPLNLRPYRVLLRAYRLKSLSPS